MIRKIGPILGYQMSVKGGYGLNIFPFLKEMLTYPRSNCYSLFYVILK